MGSVREFGSQKKKQHDRDSAGQQRQPKPSPMAGTSDSKCKNSLNKIIGVFRKLSVHTATTGEMPKTIDSKQQGDIVNPLMMAEGSSVLNDGFDVEMVEFGIDDADVAAEATEATEATKATEAKQTDTIDEHTNDE